MQLNDEQVKNLVEQSLPSIIEGFKKEITASISWEIKEKAAKQINDFVSAWIVANVFPELERKLVEAKDGLLSVSLKAAEKITEGLAKYLSDELIKNLSESWTRKKIFEALFD